MRWNAWSFGFEAPQKLYFILYMYKFLTFSIGNSLMDIFVAHNIFVRDKFYVIPPENWFGNPSMDSYSVSSENCLLEFTDWPQILASLWDPNPYELCLSVHSCTLANSCVFPLLGYFRPAIVTVLSELSTFSNSYKACIVIKQKEEKGNKDKTEVLICHCQTVCK